MPVMNGMIATKKLRKMNRLKQINLNNTRILIHSAISETEDYKHLFDGNCK